MTGSESEHKNYPTPTEVGITPFILQHQNFLAAVFGGKADDYKIPVDQQPEVVNTIYNVLGDLSLRERRILELRFGLTDGVKRSLAEVAPEFGLSRERIRQIEAKSLRKLHHPGRSGNLREMEPISGDSLAKSIFPEAELLKDVSKVLAIPLKEIDWSPQTRVQLSNSVGYGWRNNSLRNFIVGNSVSGLTRLGLQSEVLAEIEGIIRKVSEEGEEAVLIKKEVIPPSPAASPEPERISSPRPLVGEEDEEEEPLDVFDWPDFIEEDEEEEDFVLPERRYSRRAQSQIEEEAGARQEKNLLPEIYISEEKMNLLASTLLKDLGIRYNFHSIKRGWDIGRIETLGQLLCLSPQEFGQLSGIGTETAFALGMSIQKLLELPEASYKADFVARRLLEAWVTERYIKDRSKMARVLARRTGEQHERRERTQKSLLRSFMRDAIAQGATDAGAVHRFVVEKMPEILDKNSNDWVVRAVIEYLFNHPDDE